MLFTEKQIILKDGRTAVLKTPCVEDAQQLLDYFKTVCGETEFLLNYAEEVNLSVEQEATWIEGLRAAPNHMTITCYVDGEVAGNCEIQFKTQWKMAHRATVAIALRKDFWNLGIGSAMFKELIAAAKDHGSEIMELEVAQKNDRAKHLYEKFGFRVVAEKPNAFKLKDGTYMSELYMQKML